MITLHVEVPYATFRKSYARSFGETYQLPPPATIYGMLLSLVGERFRKRHEGTRLALAYKCQKGGGTRCGNPCLPHIATTLRKLSRYKYGVPSKQSKLGNAPDFIETLCGIEFICWVDSSREKPDGNEGSEDVGGDLETRIAEAIRAPANIDRYGVLCLGLSDDAVNDVNLCDSVNGEWHRLLPSNTGTMELPVWVDHVGAAQTRWQRYELETSAAVITSVTEDQWTEIVTPR